MKDEIVYYYGSKYDWEDITYIMDNDIREQVYAQLAPCTPETFLKRYGELDPTIYDYIESNGRRVFANSFDD
jgi:hypothetical protein